MSGFDRLQLGYYLRAPGEETAGDFDRWSISAQLAFLIKADHARTVELILGAWPYLESSKDRCGFW